MGSHPRATRQPLTRAMADALAHRLHTAGIAARVYGPTGYGPACYGVKVRDMPSGEWNIAAYYSDRTEDTVVADARRSATR